MVGQQDRLTEGIPVELKGPSLLSPDTYICVLAIAAQEGPAPQDSSSWSNLLEIVGTSVLVMTRRLRLVVARLGEHG